MVFMWIDQLDWWQIVLAFGVTLGFYFTWQKMGATAITRIGIPSQQYKSNTLFAGLFTLLGVWIGARIAFVFLHWSYYQSHQNEIIQIWQGGLHWSGAILGGLIFILLYAGFYNRSICQLLNGLFALWMMTSVFLWITMNAGNSALISSQIFIHTEQIFEKLNSIQISRIFAAVLLLVGALIDRKPIRNPSLAFFIVQFSLLILFSCVLPEKYPGIAGSRFDATISVGYLIITIILLVLCKKRKNQAI